MSSKIEPCPFCGSDKCSPNYHSARMWVDCDTCFARGQTVSAPWILENRGEAEEKAIEAWNKRAAQPELAELQATVAQLMAENERLRTACSKEFQSVEQLSSEIERLKGGQGEPVGVVAHRVDEAGQSFEGVIYATPIMLGLVEDGTLLYTSQPAPVSVVLPERREPTQDSPYLTDEDIEWNACLDKVKELNQ